MDSPAVMQRVYVCTCKHSFTPFFKCTIISHICLFISLCERDFGELPRQWSLQRVLMNLFLYLLELFIIAMKWGLQKRQLCCRTTEPFIMLCFTLKEILSDGCEPHNPSSQQNMLFYWWVVSCLFGLIASCKFVTWPPSSFKCACSSWPFCFRIFIFTVSSGETIHFQVALCHVCC